jgi:hypothetical protein
MSEEVPESTPDEAPEIEAAPVGYNLVWHVKLMNGEDIMGRITQPVERVYRVHEPMVLRDMDMGDGEVAMGLIRYIPGTAWNFVEVNTAHIVTLVPANDELETYYDNAVRFAEVWTDKNFDRATKVASAQLEGRIDRINRMDDPAKTEITPAEFAVMPVDGFA